MDPNIATKRPIGSRSSLSTSVSIPAIPTGSEYFARVPQSETAVSKMAGEQEAGGWVKVEVCMGQGRSQVSNIGEAKLKKIILRRPKLRK